MDDWNDTCWMVNHLIDQQNDLYVNDIFQKWLLIILYGLLILCGFVGNVFIIAVICQTAKLRNLRNYFIMHLACSDLLLCLWTAPVTLYHTLFMFWQFGDFTCKIVASAQALNTFLSSLTLTAIALDRYLLILFPLRWRSKSNALILILTCVWGIALAIAAPYFFAVGTMTANHEPWNDTILKLLVSNCELKLPQLCVERFGSWFHKSTFTLLIFLLQYIFPLSALFFVYATIARTTLNTGANISAVDKIRQQRKAQRKKRTLVLLTALVAVFGVCWLPGNLYCALDALDIVVFKQRVYIYFHLLGMVTSVLNPLLYGFLNRNLQKVLLEFFGPIGLLFSMTAATAKNNEKSDDGDFTSLPMIAHNAVKRQKSNPNALLLKYKHQRRRSSVPDNFGTFKEEKHGQFLTVIAHI